jgi:hypothetical protein
VGNEPQRGGILFLDLSRAGTGWAYGDIHAPPRTGVWRLPGDETSFGRTWAALDNELAAFLKLIRPLKVGIEAPLPPRYQTTPESGRLAFGLTATAEQTCYRFEIECVLVRADTARSKVIGRAHLSDDERRAKRTVKEAIVAPWVRQIGWEVADHNAADACVGLAYLLGYRAKPGRRLAA